MIRGNRYRHMWKYKGKMRRYWSLRLIGVKAHPHHNCCQLFTKIYGPKVEGFKEGMKRG